MNPIETKEIRGLNLRTLITLVVCTASIVGSVLATYYNLRADIHELRKDRERDDSNYDIRIKAVEQWVLLQQQQAHADNEKNR